MTDLATHSMGTLDASKDNSRAKARTSTAHSQGFWPARRVQYRDEPKTQNRQNADHSHCTQRLVGPRAGACAIEVPIR